MSTTPENTTPAIAQVVYSVPVMVLVDTASGEIQRVTVIDEEVKPTGEVANAEYSGPAPEPVAARAREIAESDAGWPAWNFGY